MQHKNDMGYGVNKQKRFDFQLRVLEKNAKELENQISRIDNVLLKMKIGVIILWVITIGWAFTSNNSNIMSMGFVILASFWMLEGRFRGVQIRYINKIEEVFEFINDNNEFDKSFDNMTLPDRLIYSIGMREEEQKKRGLLVKGLFSPTVISVYLLLALANLLAFKMI